MDKKERSRIKVLIADDHPLVRDRLKHILKSDSDLTIVGEAQTSEAVLPLVAMNHLDIVVLDVSFPDRSGIDILKDLKREHPQLPVLMVSTYNDDLLESSALQAGASAFLSKDKAATELVSTIRTILKRGKSHTPSGKA